MQSVTFPTEFPFIEQARVGGHRSAQQITQAEVDIMRFMNSACIDIDSGKKSPENRVQIGSGDNIEEV